MIVPIVKVIIKTFLYLYHRVKVEGIENIPPKGPVIIVGNHISYLDPFYIGAIAPRHIHFMAKQESFENKTVRTLLHIAEAFPVNRNKPDLQTMRIALAYLQAGKVVGIFPEGKIKGDNSFEELKHGAAYLAIKSGCSVVPVFLRGAEKALPSGKFFIRPARITISIGSLITLPETGSAKERQIILSHRIQQAFISLKSLSKSEETG